MKKFFSDQVQFLSLGKYRTDFFFKGRQDHSTIIGLLATVVLSIIILGYSISILISIAHRDEYNVQLSESGIYSRYAFTSKELAQKIQIEIYIHQEKTFPTDANHNEDANLCGGYQCILVNKWDQNQENMTCIKEYDHNSTSNTYHYVYKIIDGPLSFLDTSQQNSLTYQCECIDPEYCFTNSTSTRAADLLSIVHPLKEYNQKCKLMAEWEFNYRQKLVKYLDQIQVLIHFLHHVNIEMKHAILLIYYLPLQVAFYKLPMSPVIYGCSNFDAYGIKQLVVQYFDQLQYNWKYLYKTQKILGTKNQKLYPQLLMYWQSLIPEVITNFIQQLYYLKDHLDQGRASRKQLRPQIWYYSANAQIILL